jgi:DNA primase catalytic core
MHIKNFDSVVVELQTHLVSYLEEKGYDTKRNFSCLSPKHNDSTPSCSIIPGGIRAYCHSCSEKFDIFDAVRILEKKPAHGIGFVVDIIQYLAEKYKVNLEMGEISEEKVAEINTFRAYRDAAEYISNCELSGLATKEVSRRGWSKNTLVETITGCVKSFKDFTLYLNSKGYDEEFLKECDLNRADIFNENSLIFTTCDEYGHPVGFAARNLLFNKQDLSTGAKYINQRTTGLKANIYQKGKRLYGFNLIKDIEGPIYIFEGQGDVLTAREHGLVNCCAIGSTALTTDHILLLKEFNKFNIIICLDADKAGQDKTEKLLDTKFAGHKDMRVSIVLIPDAMDPDDYIRNNGLDAFRELAKWSAFEWRLDRFVDKSDPGEICRAMVPFIVNEPSYLAQEEMSKVLSSTTGYSFKAIQAEVSRLQNMQEERKATERKVIVEQALRDVSESPIDAEVILTDAKNKLFEISKKYDEDFMSEEAFLKEVVEQRLAEESKNDKFSGFILGPDLKLFENAMAGEWDQDVLCVVGGRANAGKSAFMCKLAYEIANHTENNALVIYHTIDDTREQLLPRLVSIAEASKQLSINQIKSPKYWGKNDPELLKKRKIGYDIVENLAKSGKLIIKDANHGMTIAYMETLIQYYQEKFPDRKIVYFLDNFHKLMDYSDNKDERTRFKKLSKTIKNIATSYHIPIISTMEYTKLPAGTRPSNNNISESVAMEYDSNLIVHLFNELHELGPNANIYHMNTDKDGKAQRFPRIEMIFGKNKITSFKSSLWFDFYPACSDFTGVDEQIIAEQLKSKELENNKKQTKESKFDPSKGLYS